MFSPPNCPDDLKSFTHSFVEHISWYSNVSLSGMYKQKVSSSEK